MRPLAPALRHALAAKIALPARQSPLPFSCRRPLLSRSHGGMWCLQCASIGVAMGRVPLGRCSGYALSMHWCRVGTVRGGGAVDRGVWTAKTVKRPRQQPAHPQYANYWAPLTRKRHTMPHSAQSQHASYWAPRTRKRHQQEHRPQRPTESSDPTQHAKGRTGDRPGPRKGATTRRNVTQGGWPIAVFSPTGVPLGQVFVLCLAPPPLLFHAHCAPSQTPTPTPFSSSIRALGHPRSHKDTALDTGLYNTVTTQFLWNTLKAAVITICSGILQKQPNPNFS